MIVLVYSACAIIFMFFIEGVYCRIAKRHQIFSREHEESNNRKPVKNKRLIKILISSLYAFVGDFTFLSFKIIGYIPSHVIRKLLYRIVYCVKLGKRCVIHYGLEARSPWNISIGDRTIVGDHVIMDARYGITIGSDVNLSSGVWIWTLQHDLNATDFGVGGQGKGVIIDNRAWVSSRTSILPGCHILEGCVIACGATLTKDTEDKFLVYGGVPAKCISKRNIEIDYIFDGNHRLFI